MAIRSFHGVEISPSERTLGEVIESSRLYVVPRFQRNYSWDREPVSDFWNDLSGLAHGERRGEGHYLGTLVVTKESNTDRYRVLDGQQRLSSTILLLCAIRDVVSGLHNVPQELGVIPERINNFLMASSLTSSTGEIKIHLNKQDHDYFSRIVRGKGLADPDHESHRLMKQAYSIFSSKIKKGLESAGPGFVQSTLKTLRDQIFIVELLVDSEVNAHILFESLNDRGMELSEADLIKNYILSLAVDVGEDEDDLLDRWEAIVSTVGDKRINRYLKQIWASTRGITRTLYKDVRKEIGSSNAVETLSQWVSEAEVFANIENPTSEFWDARTYRILTQLSKLGVVQPNVILMAGYSVVGDSSDFRKLASFIVDFTFRFSTVVNESPSELERKYSQISNKIRSGGKDLQAASNDIRDLLPPDDTFLQSFADLEMKTQYRAKYILERLNDYITTTVRKDTEQAAKTDNVQLEHILPRKPNNKWMEYYEEIGEKPTDWIHRFGNLTILGSEYNREASNGFTSKKIQMYKKSSLAINKKAEVDCGIDAITNWTPQQIKERQDCLGKLALKAWPCKW